MNIYWYSLANSVFEKKTFRKTSDIRVTWKPSDFVPFISSYVPYDRINSSVSSGKILIRKLEDAIFSHFMTFMPRLLPWNRTYMPSLIITVAASRCPLFSPFWGLFARVAHSLYFPTVCWSFLNEILNSCIAETCNKLTKCYVTGMTMKNIFSFSVISSWLGFSILRFCNHRFSR